MSFDIVFFGGTGDLTWRKLMPALFQAHRHGALPQSGRVLAMARTEMTDEQYRQWVLDHFRRLEWDEPFTDEEFAVFAQMVTYRSADLSEPSGYTMLAEWVALAKAEAIVIYLATAPGLFKQIAKGVAGVGLNVPRVRLVLEKPLGRDLVSAREINASVREDFSEQQIFRIDHYLGKQSVQNLMALRFGNILFEPLWRRESIESVHITLAEDIGVENRGGYYDRSGALRDMLQNHLLQLLCMVAMEPPVSNDPDDIRNEKLKVLRSLRPYGPGDVARDVVRGQYQAGNIQGEQVPGYLDEEGVPPDSQTETFIALRAEIDNWRWAGVPFFLRTGKRLADRGAEIVINFRQVPHSIFDPPGTSPQNRLIIKLQPEDSIEMHLLAKASSRDKAEQGRLAPVRLDLDFRETFGTETIEAYERLLRKLIAGRLDLFVRLDEQLAAWAWVMPIVDAWAQDTSPPRPYRAGTWGPAAASALTARAGVSWPEEA